ncbi:DNA-binding MarR family transcriptional regulator [Stackebrandtia albiflava]|uniref:DNA-binding MarR family transcriptional regulator n=1 Tax=Stackebrandtia albiflava TaxID=406432 RepID=A0A562V4X6_9ACTN|nr:MarR family winged helix-turn-helix transcriptional regulator [Stackebrandtia albiflava]TWJ12867.1 DNA-binding MarR family transcriptional regulator [Stackebrandtia albiflava]
MVDPLAIGTRMRQLLDAMEADIAARYAAQGVPDYRPRYSPVMRLLAESDGLPIRRIAAGVGVTHSAASQTVAQMAQSGLVESVPGAHDARQRIVRLAERGRRLLPVVEEEWTATTTAMTELDAELSTPLHRVLTELDAALARRPLRDRIRPPASPLTRLGWPECALGWPYDGEKSDTRAYSRHVDRRAANQAAKGRRIS